MELRGVSLLKLIRSGSIGDYSWDYSADGTYDNDWSTSTLMNLLNNGAYYNRTTGSYYNNSTTPITVDFSSTGLTIESREMIANVVWNLGGISSSRNFSSIFYAWERKTEVYSGRPTEWTGKIGVIYLSDYGYATSGGNTINRDICLNTFLSDWNNYNDCYNNDWLYDDLKYQWTLTPYSPSSSEVFSASSPGCVDHYNVDNTSTAVSPVLYLNPNVKITAGTGSSMDPYILSVD